MERLKHSVLFLIAGLVFFFNIERLDVNRETLVNIHSFVYVLAVLVVFSIIATPVSIKFSSVSAAIISLTMYFVMQLILFGEQVFLENIYITLAEVIMLLVLTILAHRVAGALQEFQQAVEHVALTNLEGSALHIDKSDDYIRKEMRRSRQFQRPLSVIVTKLDFQTLHEPLPTLVQEVQQNTMQRFAQAKLAKMINQEVQLVNTVLEDPDNNRFIIVCPEANNQEVSMLAGKICAMINRNWNVNVQCGTASFPDMALTFEELVIEAEKSDSLTDSFLITKKRKALSHTKN